jgi:hypothetical protein
VPAPFAGAAGLGFSARYPEQSRFAPLRDVAIWIEGPPAPMRKLVARLEMLAAARRRAHRWTDPVALTDQVIVMAFRDRSGEEADAEPAQASLDYVVNLVRPAVFPFLQDCAEIADLRLSERIDLRVRRLETELAALSLRARDIVASNGGDLLVA